MAIRYKTLTQKEYDALGTYETDLIYFVADTGKQFLNGVEYPEDADLSKNVVKDYELKGDFGKESNLQIDGKAVVTVSANGKIDPSLVPEVGGTTWGAITGTLSEQTDLQTALNGKANTSDIKQADWDESDSSDVSFIKGKPYIADYTDYLHMYSIPNEGGNRWIRINKIGTPDPISIEYSYDKQNWTEYTWTDSTGEALDTITHTDIWLRATSTNDHICKDASNGYRFVGNGVPVYFDGNIMSLKDKTLMTNTVKAYDFYGLFKDWAYSIKSAPKLPSLKLADYCYACLFEGCNYLKECPELPANTIYDHSYYRIFAGCTSLQTVCDLNVDYGKNNCFESMFEGCTGILEAKPLKWVDIKGSGGYMFKAMYKGCTSLVKGADMPIMYVTTSNWLSDNYHTFESMYEGCVNLKETPVFQSFCFNGTVRGWVDKYMYSKTFKGCTSLKTAKFPDTSSSGERYCFESMYEGCTGIEQAILPETSSQPKAGFLNTIFKGCTSLKYISTKLTSWQYNDGFVSSNWLEDASATGIFDCPASLDTTTRDVSHVPSGWTVTHGSNEPSDDTTSTVEAMSTDVYTVCAGSTETGVLTVDSALTLNALPNASTEIAYAEVVIDLGSNATVTAGSNITFVDTLTAGKRNVCVVRWSGGVAKLYVTIVEDLDESSSSN